MATTRGNGYVVTAAVWNAVLSRLTDDGATFSGAVNGSTGAFSSTLAVTGASTLSGIVGVAATPISGRSLVVGGAGDDTAVTDAGNKTSSLLISTSAGSGGHGGSIELGFGRGAYAQPYFAAIKALGENGASNTAGSLGFFTRAAVADTSLTERMRITPGGLVAVTGIVQASAQPGFLARKTSDTTGVTSGTDVTFDSEVYDTGGVFASSTFTAPVTGVYALFGGVGFVNASGSGIAGVGIGAVVNGTDFWHLARVPQVANTERCVLPIAGLINLTAGDTVTIRYIGVGGDITVEGLNTSTRLTFWGMRLLA